MKYLIVLLLAVSASATYDYGQSYYPSTYGTYGSSYGGYYGYGSGLGYGIGGYSYAPSSYYSGGAAISKYISPAVTSYAAPAVTSYAAPISYAAPAVSYVKPAVSYAAAPAVSYVKPAVSYAAAPAVSYVSRPAATYAAAPAVSYVSRPAATYAAAPAVSYVKPAVTSYAAAPAVSYVSRPAATYVAAAPRIQNPLIKGGSYISFNMGSANRHHSGISSSEHGSAFKSHQNKASPFPGSKEDKPAGFPNFPESVTDAALGSSGIDSEVSDHSKVKPGVEYADEKREDSTHSNGKPSDSSFFDATKSSENDNSGYDSFKLDSNDKSSFGSDSSFFDATKSSENDDSGYDSFKPDSNAKSSFGSDSSFFDATKSSEKDDSGYDSLEPDSNDKSSFGSDSFFDGTKSSETDRSGTEIVKPEHKNRKSFDSDRSVESNGAGFEYMKSSHSQDKTDSFFSRFDVDMENRKRQFSSRPGVKQPFLGDHKSPFSTDGQFLAGTPKIKFVMGNRANGALSTSQPVKSIPYPKRVFRERPTNFRSTLRDRIFYLSETGGGPAYDYSSVYGPSASLLYDGGDATFYFDDAEPKEEVFVF